jgi:TolB protein
MFPLLVCLAFAAEPAPAWEKDEAAHLTNIKQLTKDFVRAGEGYFSPDGKTIIFQAEEKEGGNPFYQIFTMNLETGKLTRISPGVGKTTCSYFAPDGKKIIFASSHLDPDAKKKQEAEYKQREEDAKAGKHRSYRWDFDPQIAIFEANPDGSDLKQLTKEKGYHAEGSFSPDGKQIVFCSNRDNPDNFELYVMNRDGTGVRQLTHAPNCYNGGPFFSPDGKHVVFRSDRKKKDYLQLYVIDVDGKNERALTDDLNMNHWAPYWYKDGKHIIYTVADQSDPKARPNFDLYWMDVDTGKKVRLTFAPGADVLPVFSPDYKKIMWTSTRDGRQPAQLWIADFTPPSDK